MYLKQFFTKAFYGFLIIVKTDSTLNYKKPI